MAMATHAKIPALSLSVTVLVLLQAIGQASAISCVTLTRPKTLGATISARTFVPQMHANGHQGRRALLQTVPLLAIPAWISPAQASTRAGLLGKGDSVRCEGGDGEACSALAEGNALILRLQEQSRANREKNEKELYEKTVRQLGYSDYFAALDKNLVQMPDGKYAVLDAGAYNELVKAGKVKRGSVDQVIEP